MNVYIKNHKFHYEVENLVRVFFPNEKIVVQKECEKLTEPYVFTELSDEEVIVTAKIGSFEKKLSFLKNSTESKNEIGMTTLLYKILVEESGTEQPWGLLTGVRPIKLFKALRDNYGTAKAGAYFLKTMFCSSEKTALAIQTERNQQRIVGSSRENSFSLYVSVPFCPSRCNYCSFVSQSIDTAKHLMLPYTDLLCKELRKTAEIAKKHRLKLETVYIGGGTPTILEEPLLSKILQTINQSFDMSTCREFTVEAGRPDTITKEKLSAMKENGVDRISINPQTLSDEILEKIGRKHTIEQFWEAYNLARKLEFKSINIDLIAGLPDDSYDNFCASLNGILERNPENITVHTFCLKRSSTLAENNLQIQKENGAAAAKMLRYSQDRLKGAGYAPYYLYRQSRMVGNLENVGWCKPGHDGMYNIFIMDETHSVLACGAGAVTKLRVPGDVKINRIFNFKYPYEYINRYREMLERKFEVDEWFGEVAKATLI